MNREEIGLKAIKAYNTIINTFSLENLGEQLFDREFTIEFLIDRGAGIDSYFIERFSSFGISENKITFTPSNSYSLKNAISSLITYLYFFSDTFYTIKQGESNFMFGDIFNIHSPEYVADSSYSEIIEGNFMWSGDGSANGLTRENYEILAAEFSADDRFTHHDIRYLVGFDNEDIVSLLLNQFQTMFRQEVDENIHIKDLRIGAPQTQQTYLFGDFPFKLNDYYDSSLIGELISQGITVAEFEVVGIVKNREDRIIWLTQGTERRGFIHILARHGESGEPDKRFSTYFGISDDPQTIGNFIFNAIKNYPIHLKLPGAGAGSFLYVYEIRRSGNTNYLKIVVDDEGEIITAFPDKYEN